MAQITLRDYLQQTEDAISSSRVDDALTHCQLILSHFPEALEIQRLLGEVYLAQGRLEDAQHIFDWVLTNDPENVAAYCNRAHVSERLSEYDAALDCYQQAYELSRGNGQIREDFNRLSEKIGQKGFMFSRAGLARLYMRGDSLPEAIQEWDAVLAVSPDRLDARTGLLETYWRAGLLENVEQLAEQILRNVPGCLKALLLQASVISSKNSKRSQELLRQAEALDPDHITAQTLFADALVSHPDDPFLRQLKKAPVLLPEAKEVATPQGLQQNSFAPASDPINTLESNIGSNNNIDALALWGKDAYGNNDTTLIKPRSNTPSAPAHKGTSPSWGDESFHDNSSLPSIPLPTSTGTNLQASLHAPIQEMNNFQSSQETGTKSKEHSPEPWELLQDALNQLDANGAKPRGATESLMAPYSEDLPLWENMPASGQPSLDISPSATHSIPKPQESISLSGIGLDLWATPTEEPIPPVAENISSSPNWVDMQPQTDIATSRSDPSAFTLESRSNNELPLVDSSPEQLAQSNTTSSGEKFEEDEESFFGPSWLKSLGATTMAEEETPAITASAPEAQTPHIAEPEHRVPQHAEEHSPPPLAQYSEDLMQVPSAEYAEMQPTHSNHSAPEPNPYESWSQASLNNSPNIYELTSSWTSAEVAEHSEHTNYETGSSHEDAYASGTALPLSSVDLPAEEPAQAIREKAEYNLMTTLEELEQSLWSKGFIPLEPNSLSSLTTQAQESSVSAHDLDTLKAPEEYGTQEFQHATFRQEPQETPDAPSLSSALAQLGSFVKEPPSPEIPSIASSFETLEQSEEPSWLQALKNSSTTPVAPAMPTWSDTSLEPSAATPAVPAMSTWPDISLEPSAPAAFADNSPQIPPVQVEPIITTSHNQTQPTAKELQKTVKAPAVYGGNPLLDVDGELETTMKRPAVRLQSMQRPSSPSQRQEEAPIIPRSQSRERVEKAPRVARPANENLSYRDRLIKGYQHQLVGDYDEAMQEYRIIIRSGTDLLSEVVSNVRALLKLAPNYSAGYRVLGDAYMRQGEYLQAMEAYNKALSMTKKVKSRT